MLILFIIYVRINFYFVVVYYTDDGSLELGTRPLDWLYILAMS